MSPEEIKTKNQQEAQRQAMADRMRIQQAKLAEERAATQKAKEERVKAQELQHSQPFQIKLGNSMFQERIQQKAEKQARALMHAQMAKQKQAQAAKRKATQPKKDAFFFVSSMFDEPASWAAACKPCGAPRRMSMKAAGSSPKSPTPPSPTMAQAPKQKHPKVAPETHFIPQVFHHVVGFATSQPTPPKRLVKKAVTSPEAAKAKLQQIMKSKKAGQAMHKQRAAGKKARNEPNWGGPDGVAEMFAAFPVPEAWTKACHAVGGVKRTMGAQKQQPAAPAQQGNRQKSANRVQR